MNKEILCKVCGTNIIVMNSKIKKSISLTSGCCSFFCFKTTQEYFERRRKSDELRIQKIRETGSFSFNGSLSKITRAKRFLERIGVVCASLSDEEIISLWKLEFNKQTGHGQKIKLGLEKKHPNVELRHNMFKERVVKASCTVLGIQYKDAFTTHEKQEINKKAYQNFRVKDTKSWKLKHIIKNSTIDIVLLTDDEVDILYAEYVSNRFNRRSLESTRNGYLRTAKGWYEMSNQPGDKFFYRSSWEKVVFEALDILVGERKIKYVKNPDRIEYTLDGVRRHYYPDAAFINLFDKTIVLEIKPKRKVNEPANLIKFESAINTLGKYFQVLTEDDIFEGELLKKLENF